MRDFKGYSWYELPDGWEKLFIQMWNDIKPMIIEAGLADEFKFLQVKEKFGQLRVYISGSTIEIDKVIFKYEYISQFICVNCGRPAQYETTGYIAPLCESCIKENQIQGSSQICFNPIIEVRKYSKNGTEYFRDDVSDIWERYICEE